MDTIKTLEVLAQAINGFGRAAETDRAEHTKNAIESAASVESAMEAMACYGEMRAYGLALSIVEILIKAAKAERARLN